MTRDTLPLTYCRAFSSGVVTTCFNDLGLSQLGFEYPTFSLRGERSNPLRNRRCCIFVAEHHYLKLKIDFTFCNFSIIGLVFMHNFSRRKFCI